MPGIVLFGRRCRFASDDLIVPAIYGVIVDSTWMAITGYLYATEIEDQLWKRTYLSLCFAVFALEIFLDWLMGWLALRGTVADDRPRRHTAGCFYSLVCLFLLETVMHVTALGLIYSQSTSSSNALVYCASLFLVRVVLVLLWLVFELAMSVAVDEGSKMWACCLMPLLSLAVFVAKRRNADDMLNSGQTSETAANIAALFSALFSDATLIPSDVLIGLMLVKEQQLAASGVSSQPSPRTEMFGTLQELDSRPFHMSWMNMAWFYDYAVSIYGFPLYMFSNFGSGFLHLCCPWSSTAPRSATEAMRKYIDRGWSSYCLCCCPASCIGRDPKQHEDLFYTSLGNELFKTPFMVCLDHQKKAIVVAIRGTLSISDLVVDLHFGVTEIVIPAFNGSDSFVAHTHHGIYQTARTIFNELDAKHVIHSLLEMHPDYKLVTCGHSLGGGVAILLAHLFKTSPGYHRISSNTFAFGYSPPGCMITAEAQDYFLSFCTSVVLGDDVIPRLTPRTVHALKEDVKAALRRCNDRRKVDIVASALVRVVLKYIWRITGQPSMASRRRSAFTPIFGTSSNETRPDSASISTPLIESLAIGQLDEPPRDISYVSFIAGHIVHIRRIRGTQYAEQRGASVDHLVDRRYSGEEFMDSEFEIILGDAEEFHQIHITNAMGIDHLPNRLEDAFRSLQKIHRI